MKPITHRPKVGEILECNFGKWSEPPSFDGHLPPEMCKKRMVVVLNSRGRLREGAESYAKALASDILR